MTKLDSKARQQVSEFMLLTVCSFKSSHDFSSAPWPHCNSRPGLLALLNYCPLAIQLSIDLSEYLLWIKLCDGLGTGMNPIWFHPMGAVYLRTGVKHISHPLESEEELNAMWKFTQWLCQWDFHCGRWQWKRVAKSIAGRRKSMSKSQRHENIWYMSKGLAPGFLSSLVLHHPSHSAVIHICWVPTMSQALFQVLRIQQSKM